MKLPESFQQEMIALLGADTYEQYLSVLDQPAYQGLRVNTGKISCEEFEKIIPFPLKKIPWIPNGYYYDGNEYQPAKHPYYYAGLYYLQEPSAMTPASRLPIEPGDRVLDVCAAPGGKATELGTRCKGEGAVLYANDISRSRCRALLKNLELMGIGHLYVTNEEPEHLSEQFPAYFDKILIDAPCSGEGMFRKERSMPSHWEKQGPLFYQPIQKNIIVLAANMLRPGGMMLYSTCTFSILENETVIQHLLEEVPDMELIPMEGYEGFAPGVIKGLEDCVRIFPQNMNGEGHFLALLRKKGETTDKINLGLSKKKLNLTEEAEEFLSQIPLPTGCTFRMEGERLFALPAGTEPAKRLHYFRCGLYLGMIKKKRFEPSQSLAMYLKQEDYKYTVNFAADDPRVIKYLKGETIEADLNTNGYVLICVDGFPLGWGKYAQGRIKNKYNTGWRWQ